MLALPLDHGRQRRNPPPVCGPVNVELLEDLLQPLDVGLGLGKVLGEAGLQLLVRRGLGHLGQRFNQLRFGAVQVVQLLDVQIAQSFEFHCLLILFCESKMKEGAIYVPWNDKTMNMCALLVAA